MSVPWIRKLPRTIALIRTDENGNVAVTLAIALFAIFASAGAAVDYTHANTVRAGLQSAVDASALILSRSAAKMENGILQAAALEQVIAQFRTKGSTLSNVTATYTLSSVSSLHLKATAVLDTHFMHLFGHKDITVGADTMVQWGDTRLRLALALDVTGSMSSSNKMSAMKTAAKNLLVQLESAASGKEDVYVAMVPFSKDVAVEKTNYGQSWLRWDLWEEYNGSCSRDRSSTKSECLSARGRWTPASRNTWNGCLTDRDQPYDTTNTQPSANSATLFPAEQYSACPTPMLPLTNDWSALKAKVDAMQPNGNTNQAIGLQWAFQLLTSDSPYAMPPKATDHKYKDVIILLTDGLNTEARGYTTQAPIDARQKITCDNVRTAGITVYSVQVNTNGDPTSALLKYCASSADKLSILTSANQIIETFDTIGRELTKLRLAE